MIEKAVEVNVGVLMSLPGQQGGNGQENQQHAVTFIQRRGVGLPITMTPRSMATLYGWMEHTLSKGVPQ